MSTFFEVLDASADNSTGLRVSHSTDEEARCPPRDCRCASRCTSFVSQFKHLRMSLLELNVQISFAIILSFMSFTTLSMVSMPSEVLKITALKQSLNSGWQARNDFGTPLFCCADSSIPLSTIVLQVGGIDALALEETVETASGRVWSRG